MTEHERETWQQNDYDPKFIDTYEDAPRRIARAFTEADAEQIVAEHNAFSELLVAAKTVVLCGATYSKELVGPMRGLIDVIDKAQRTEDRR